MGNRIYLKNAGEKPSMDIRWWLEILLVMVLAYGTYLSISWLGN